MKMLDGLGVVGDVLDAAVQRHGNKPAVQDATGVLTFIELRDRARRLANALLHSGLRPGDRVLEALPNSCELLVSEMALALAGLVRVPLNPRLGAKEWRGIRDDSGARGLIVDGSMIGADGTRIPETISCEITVRVDGGGLAELIESGSPQAALPSVGSDDLAGLAYSSGTTGMPKGALRTHKMRLAAARAMLRDAIEPSGEATAYLHAGPAIHTSGLFVLPMLALGVRQVMAHHLRPAEIAATVHAENISHLALVPSVIDALTHLPASDRAAFSGVRMLAYAGAPMPPAQIRRAAEHLTRRLVQYYGLVEAIPPLTVLGIADHARGLGAEPGLLASAGRVVSEARVQILTDDGVGEIAVSGPMVTPGYWNAARRTDLGKSFSGDALLTGDVGRVVDGYLYLTDRKNNMMISGGYNIYPGEIESAVESSNGLRAVVVVGLPDERWGERITLAYTTTSGHELDQSQLDALHARLAALTRHKQPKSCHFMPEFPLGATGKIDRRAVTAQLAAVELTSSSFLDPERTPSL